MAVLGRSSAGRPPAAAAAVCPEQDAECEDGLCHAEFVDCVCLPLTN